MSRGKINYEKRLNILISHDLRKKYKQYCLKKDMILSDRIRELIEKDLKGEIK